MPPLMLLDDFQKPHAIGVEFAVTHARELVHCVQAHRAVLEHLLERGVAEDHVGGYVLLFCEISATLT